MEHQKEKSKQAGKRRGLNFSLMIMTIVSFVIVGLFISICVSKLFKKIILNEVRENLKDTALIVKYTMDYAYPGDLEYVGEKNVAIVKGEKVLNSDYALIDDVAKDTKAEVTVFYGNTRILTTILNGEGERIIETTISDKVTRQVLEKGKSVFYKKVLVGRKYYCGYYMPVTNADGENKGMIGVLQSLDTVNRKIRRNMWTLMMVFLVGLVVMAVVSFRYANQLIARIRKIQSFIVRISNEDFKVRLEEKVFDKKDEITDIAKSADKMQSSLRKLIELDALTEINNRRSGDKMLEEARERFDKQGEKFAVALADIDFFKKVNDTYGHQCGDMVLKEVAAVFRKNMLGKGFVARWGGEEFLLVFEDMALDRAHEVMQQIVQEIRQKKMVYQEYTLSVTLTCGMTEGRNEHGNVLVKEVDDKLYHGKQNGRNQIVI